MLNTFLCILLVTVISSQLYFFGKTKLTQAVSRNADSFFCGVTLSLTDGNGKNVQILVNGNEFSLFDKEDVNIPISTGSVIEVYNPSDRAVSVNITDVSESVSIIKNENIVICPKGITYICKAFCQ